MPFRLTPPVADRAPSFVSILLAGLALTLGCAAQAQVQALSAQDLPAFLAAHEVAVVQYTSPDTKCGYCVGADKPFDLMAALSFDPRRGYARVQWKPWQQFPSFPAGVQATAKIPMMHIYVHGQFAGQYEGRPGDALDMPMRVYQSVARQLASRSPLSPDTPLTAQQRRLTQVFVRMSLLQSMLLTCAQKSPQQLPSLQAALRRALKPLQGEVEAASRLGDSDPDRWPGMGEIAQAQIQQREAWMTRTLKLPSSTLDEGSCAQVAQGIGSWPLP